MSWTVRRHDVHKTCPQNKQLTNGYRQGERDAALRAALEKQLSQADADIEHARFNLLAAVKRQVSVE